jgi:Activator of Hsp90 ATPase homolog 1-like protein
VTNESGRVVRIERTFAASAEEVFDAWTSPEVMRRWLHPAPDWETPEAEVDLRVGGKVRVVMRRPDGTKIEAQCDAPRASWLRTNRDRQARRHICPLEVRGHPPQGAEVRRARYHRQGVQALAQLRAEAGPVDVRCAPRRTPVPSLTVGGQLDLESPETGVLRPVAIARVESAFDAFPHPRLAPDLVLPHGVFLPAMSGVLTNLNCP